ncbi:MAG: TonB-dependent receptor [Terracidiphilus sp.]
MMCIRHIAGFAAVIVLGAGPLFGAPTASVSGQVRDSSGVPQIGAEVELLRPDLSVVTSVYTNDEGRFVISSLLPGRYAVKAMSPSFLPSLREDVRVRGVTVVNLTLNTLYEVIQWLPADPRTGGDQKDDWAWTLRSAANRPLLRWLEDGPLVVVSDGSGGQPKLKARLIATGETGTFGESGERISTSLEDSPAKGRELLARVDFAPGSDGSMESMLGFRQDLGFAGSVQSVAAVTMDPEVEGGGGQGLDEAAIHSEETMRFGDAIEAEAGANLIWGRMNGMPAGAVSAMLPFAAVARRDGNSTFHYQLTTMVPGSGSDESEVRFFQPTLAERGGRLSIESGVHQEIGWERRTDASSVSMAVYADNIENPVIEALGHFAAGDSLASSAALFDRSSDLLRVAGPGYSTAGVEASLGHRLPGGNFVRVSYASGSAMVVPALPQPSTMSQIIAGVHPHRAQTYAITLSGTLDGTGTRWRASYRWQPDETVTAVAPYEAMAESPFLNLLVRQPIHLTRDGSGGFEALLDVRNLLAQGYSPYILSDGSLLIFAQDQRSVRAGLAFTF